MAGAYEIELSEPAASRCDCCDGLTVRLTRFVCRAGDAFAIYYARYSSNHPDHELAILVSLGEWGEGSTPAQRVAFYCRVRPLDASYQVMLGDAASSAWSDVELVGEKLSREQALRHPWKATAFELVDEAFLGDPSLRGFLQRVECGDAAVPLERNYQLPDEVAALGDERKHRAEVRRDFAALDGKRFFVRGLLPVPVESYGAWCVSLWVEVSRADHDRALAAWDDPAAYPTLRVSGALANDVGAELDLPVPAGTEVQLHVTDPEALPGISALGGGELPGLSELWARTSFEAYAVARGFL